MKKTYLLMPLIILMGFIAGDQKIEEVIKAEKAFAALAMSKDTRAAFMANMDENSMIAVEGKLVKGLPVYKNQPEDTTGNLKWKPSFAAVSDAGDLGYTTGPYTYTLKNGKDVGFGHYATVWQKTAQGWKLVIDLGSTLRSPATEAKDDTLIKVMPDKVKGEIQTADLMELDKSFSSEVATTQKPYLNYTHPEARICRSGRVPAVTAQQRETLFTEATPLAFTAEGFRLSKSGDFGLVYGHCDMKRIRNGQEINLSGPYMRVWRKDAKKGWQILHETISAAPVKKS